MATEWFYERNGERQGPVSGSELKQMAKNGDLQPDNLVWKEGMPEWKSASSIKELFPQAAAVRQPPSLPPLPSKSPVAVRKAGSNKALLVIGVAGGGFLMMMFLCCGVLGFMGGSDGEARRSRTTAEVPAEDIITLTSDQLFAEYDANDIAADKKYKGRILEVSGSVSDISRDILDNIYVTLKSGQFEVFSIQCFFADSFEDKAAELRPDQYLTIRGRCDGKFGNVMLKDCIIVE